MTNKEHATNGTLRLFSRTDTNAAGTVTADFMPMLTDGRNISL